MAATIPEYVIPLIENQYALANLLGVNLLGTDPQTYRVNLTVIALISVVLKALNDKGVVLDAEWLTRLAAIPTGTWPDWLLNQTAPPAGS